MNFSEAVTAMLDGMYMQPVPPEGSPPSFEYYRIEGTGIVHQVDPRQNTNPLQPAELTLLVITRDWQEIPPEAKEYYGIPEVEPVEPPSPSATAGAPA